MLSILGANVFVEPIRDPNKTPGGLYIPDTAEERVDQGIVKYCGPKVRYVQPGMWVFFPGYSGTNYFSDDEGHLIRVHEREIQCVLHDISSKLDGIYFKDKKGLFHPFTYESLIREISSNIRTGKLVMGKASMKYSSPDVDFFDGEWEDDFEDIE